METINNNKYANGKIYKLISQTHPDCVYYGSTTQKLCLRMAGHRRDFKKNNNNITSKQVLQFEDAQIILVINFSCNSRDELTAKEADYIRNNECVNKQIPGNTDKEYREDNKEQIKQYREDNKEQIKDKVKQYYLENKSKLREKRVKYLENNKDEINLRRRNKYKENRLVKKE